MPSTKFGQNFLQDSRIAERIVKYAEISKNDIVLEIGPGYGIITNEIVKRAKHVIAVEKDTKLFNKLVKIFPNIEIIKGDILKMNIPYFDILVSNLPFEISSPILEKLSKKEWKTAVLVVQKEFGERFFSSPGKKKYSRLTIFMNYYFNCEKMEVIPRWKFCPKPKVDAMIVRLKKRIPPFDVDERFWSLVNLLFRHKRKIVRSALKVEGIGKDDIGKLKNLGTIRVNNLTMYDIKEIYDALSQV